MEKGKGTTEQPPDQPADVPAVWKPPPSMTPAVGTALADCPTNLDLTTDWGKALALAAMSPGDLELDQNGTLSMEAVSFLIYPDKVVNRETGELVDCVRTVLYTGDGRTFKTTSESGADKIRAILSLWGVERWKKGIPFIITERKSRKTGRMYHDLRVGFSRPAQPEGTNSGQA